MTILKYICNFHTPGKTIAFPDSPCPICEHDNAYEQGCWDCKYMAISIKDRHVKGLEPVEEQPLTYADFLKKHPDCLEID